MKMVVVAEDGWIAALVVWFNEAFVGSYFLLTKGHHLYGVEDILGILKHRVGAPGAGIEKLS
jgi:hypothetical protein